MNNYDNYVNFCSVKSNFCSVKSNFCSLNKPTINMKKILFAAFALVITLGLVSCKDKPAESTGQPATEAEATPESAGPTAEQTVNPQDVKSLVDKAQKEGTNWSVDQWKACIKDVLTVIAPKMIELDALMEDLKDPAKIQETMDKMKVYEQEFQPIDELLATFRKAAESTPNGKIAIEDIEYNKQVKRELGIKVEDDKPAE